MSSGRRKQFAVLWLLIAAAALVSPREAVSSICAEVRLEIKQEATLEREAFDARLEVNNNFPAYGLENFRVNVVVKDASGSPADGLFFIKISSKQGVGAVDGTGIVQPASTATINWLIIPSTGAGGINPLGLRYSVKADISYTINGVPQLISTYEDFITVKPQPVLRLEYILPFEVFSDEPLTESVVEPVEPFPLGVRITNAGYGPARNFQINSGQPEIIENKQGLAIDFKLLGTYVGQTKIPDTLLIPFGDIAAGGVSQASWIMATSLSGRFTQFKATFTHTAELGGQLTSLIKDVTTYTLIKDVLVDAPGRDSHFDFLVNTTTPRAMMESILNGGGEISPELILESDQPLPITVYHAASELSGSPTAADPVRTLKITEEVAPGPWLHVSAPVLGVAVLATVKRSDGKTLSSANAWISRHFNKNDTSYTYRLNILDHDVPKFAEYKAELSLHSVDQAPGPVTLSAVPAASGAILLTWAAPGEDGNTGDMIGGRYLIQAEQEAGAQFDPTKAQVNITTNTTPGAAQSYIVSGLAGNTSYYLKLWTQDTSGNISPVSNIVQAYALPNSPKDPVLSEISSSSVKTVWAIGNNWLPINYQVFADTDTAAPYAFSSPLFDFVVTSHVFTKLIPNTTYFFFGRAVNPETLAVSGDAVFGAALTLAALPESPVFKDITPSSFTVTWSGAGNPQGTEYLVEISTNISGSPVAASSGWVAQTDHVFVSLLPDTTYYARAKAKNYAGVETTFVDLGVLRTKPVDLLPPVTNIAFSVPDFGMEPVYISSLTKITLTAYDDAAVIGDRLGGLAAVYYSVDSDTFTVYAGSFSIVADGAHIVRYYSADAAGNTETVKTSSVTVDNVSPSALIDIAGVVYSSGAVSYIPAASTITLGAYDQTSGVKELCYELNGSTYSVAAASKTLELSEGAYTLVYSAADNLGNVSAPQISFITVDNTAPLTVFEIAGSSLVIDGKLYLLSASSITLSASDATSGMKEIYYSLDNATAAAVFPIFLLPGAGEHTLVFYSADNVGNAEAEHSVTFFVDAVAPVTTASVAGLAGANGWYVSPVSLTLVSTDAMSGVKTIVYKVEGPGYSNKEINYTSSFIMSAEGIYTVRYHSIDNAGNVEPEQLFPFKIDLSSPTLVAFAMPAANVYGWNNTSVDIVFTATEAVSGIAYCSNTQTISVEGSSQAATGYCTDYAGWSSTKTLTVSIDRSSPTTAFIITGVYSNGLYISSVIVNLSPADALSGILETRCSLDNGAFQIYFSSFTVEEDGPHIVNFYSIDKAGNIEAVQTSTFTIQKPLVDSAPPVTDLQMAGIYYSDGVNHFVSPSGNYITLTSTDSLSGVKTIYYKVDPPPEILASGLNSQTTVLFTIYSATFSLQEGKRTVAYGALDMADNYEALKSSIVYVDGTAPGSPIAPAAEGANPSPWKNTREYNLTWTNPADASGVAGTRVKFGGAKPVSNYEGTFYPADGSLNYSALDAINGANPIWLWLQDNVENADPSTAVELSLRYDDTPPASTVSSPAGSNAAVIPVAFNSTDPGPGSGVKETVLWRRNNSVAWSSGSYVLSGSSGSFNFNTAGTESLWGFYTQAFDNAGNAEPAPVSTTPAKASTYFDMTPPTISNASVSEITPGTARITWETDDETTGTVNYGTPSPALEFRDSIYSTRHSVLLDGLVYPANYAFTITAVNRGLLSVEYIGGSFYVPPRIETGIDYFGVLNVNQPIVIEVTNPQISSITYTLDGQIVTQAVTPFVPLEIYTPAGGNQASLSLNLDGFTYSTSFIVDTATRTVRLARLVVSAGGLMSDIEPGKSVMDMTTGQDAQEEMSSGESRLFLGYYAGIDPMAPGAVNTLSAVSGPASGQAALSWTAPGDDDDAGTAMKYDIRWSTSPINSSNFETASIAGNIPFPQTAGAVQQTIVSGLNLLTTYYFSLRTYDELNNISALSNTAVLFNGYALASTVTINGVPEISFISPVPPIISLVSAVSAAGTVAMGSASAGGLTLAGNLYEIGPEGVFDPPAVLTFYYSTSTLAALGLLESDIAIYEYSAVWGWIKLPDQTLDPENRRITVPISRIASLFGIFGVVKDRFAPVTGYRVEGVAYRTEDGRLYINAASSVALTAYDPIVYGTSSGVDFTEFRIDSGTSTPFILYISPFALSTGAHIVEFRSLDNAGNAEPVKSTSVFADGEPPVTEFSLAGASSAADGTLYTATGSTVTLVSSDTASGVKALYYAVNGATYSAPSGRAEIILPAEGGYSFRYYAADNVDNSGEEKSATVQVDTTPPAIIISSPAAGQIFIATRNKIDVGFDIKDNFDPAPKADAFLVQTEDRGSPRSGRSDKIAVTNGQAIEPLDIDDGIWRLAVSATDFAQNSTTAVSGLFEVVHDTLAPRSELRVEGIGYRVSAATASADREGIEYVTGKTTFTLTSVDDLITPGDGMGLGVKKQRIEVRGQMSEVREVVFENPEPGQGETFVSTFTLAGAADGIYSMAYNAEDIIGNIEEVKISSYAADNTAPETAYKVEGIGYKIEDGIVYISERNSIALAAADPVVNGVSVGVLSTVFKTDAGDFAQYVSSLTLAEGRHKIVYYSSDRLGNLEPEKTLNVYADATPPVTSLTPGGDYYIPQSGANAGDWYAAAWFAYKLSAYDPVVKDVSSGLFYSEYLIIPLAAFGTEPVAPTPQELGRKFTPFDYADPLNSFSLAEGINRVDFRSHDNVLNAELRKTATIYIDATPPVSQFVFISSYSQRPDGLILSSSSPLTISATDPLIKGVASGVRASWFVSDGGRFLTWEYDPHTGAERVIPWHLPDMLADGYVDLRGFSTDNTGNNETPFAQRIVLDNTPPTAFIISPSASVSNHGLCKLVGGTDIKIIGSVTDRGQMSEAGSQNLVEFDHFQSYTLEFGYGAAPASYTLISSSSPGFSLEGAVLGVWDTTGLPEGVYTLKLTAKDCVGNEAVATAQVIVSQPKLTLSLGSRGSGAGEFNSPSYIAIDPRNSDFWISDTNNDRVQKFSSSGTFVFAVSQFGAKKYNKQGKEIPNSGDKFNKPTGVAVDANGNLWVADRNNDRVLKFDSSGMYAATLAASFNKPHGLAVDAAGNLWVADRNNDAVRKFSPGGNLLLTINTGIGTDFNKPQGVIAVDYLDRVYITDRNNDRALIYDSSGTYLKALGSGSGSGAGQFNKPDGIAVNALAYAYVADANNSRVQKFDQYGNLVMVFDRASNDAEAFNHPGGLALDADGNLFVVDSNNAKVKKFGAEGELVRIASQEDNGQPQSADGASAARLVARAVGGKVHHPKGITVDIPAGALGSDTEITITGGHRAEGSGYRAQGAGGGKKLASITEAVEFGPAGAVFEKPVTISIPYDPSRLAAGVSESELVICRFNQSSRSWEELPSAVDTRLKVVSAQTAHFSLYTVMAPVVGGSGFALGEVYVFPNPAKGAQVPTFHIEAGMADKVTIKIYTVSGRLAHETTLTGLPQIIDDGHGSEYAYEYAWNGNIPSGVYYYFIEAEKIGNKLKKTGKFAVVR